MRLFLSDASLRLMWFLVPPLCSFLSWISSLIAPFVFLRCSRFSLSLYLLLIAAPGAAMSRAVAPSMVADQAAEPVLATVAAAGTLLASNAGDFGGYTIPIIGLALLAAIIGILAGPVED